MYMYIAPHLSEIVLLSDTVVVNASFGIAVTFLLDCLVYYSIQYTCTYTASSIYAYGIGRA